MKKTLILFVLSVLVITGPAFSGLVTFKMGYFIPSAGSDLWDEEFFNMSFIKSDFHSTNFGFGYEYFISKELSFILSIEGYSKQKYGFYDAWVGYIDPEFSWDWAYPAEYEGDFKPGHTFSVSITPLQFSLKLTPLGRKGGFIPYVGGGVGVYLWSVRIRNGDFIDFSEEWYDEVNEVTIYPIYSWVETREENRLAVGYHALGGVMIPLANRITVEVEFKYNFSKGNFPEDNILYGFWGFEPLDLGGYQISLGLNYWF